MSSRLTFQRKAVTVFLAIALSLAASAAWGAPKAQPVPKKPQAPDLNLKSASVVLMEAASGQIIYEKDPHERRHPASVTKVMTLVLVFDALREGKITLDDEVEASPSATRLGGTQIWLEVGERMKVSDLLKAVAIASANDASVALAEHVAGTEEGFVAMMNEKAQELGMKNTHFANPHGLDANDHYTTAHDLALLSRYATSQPELVQLTSIYRDKLKGNRDKEIDLDNRNKLVRFYQGADGLKTGWTTGANYTLAATAKRGETRMIATIMGAPDAGTRMAEARKMLDFGFASFHSILVAKGGEAFGSPVRVKRGVPDRLTAVLAQDFLVTVRRGQDKGLVSEVELPPGVEAPVAQGQVLGYLVVKKDGIEAGRAPLVAPVPVARAGYFRLTWEILWDVLWPGSGR